MLALLDAATGLAGNMLLAALLDLGLPEAEIHAPLAALGLVGAYRLELEERRSGGLRGLHLAVTSLEPQPAHRRWGELRRQLEPPSSLSCTLASVEPSIASLYLHGFLATGRGTPASVACVHTAACQRRRP